MALTDTEIRDAKPSGKPRKIFDGGGLFLLLTTKGGKWWRLKYRFRRKENQLSLGRYPDVSIAEARELRDKCRRFLADGIDPSERRKADKVARRAEEARQAEQARRAEEARRIAATRFIVDNNGSLTFRCSNRRLTLTPAETAELRVFLHATRTVGKRVTSCR